MLQMSFFEAQVASLSHSRASDGLGNAALNPGPDRILFLEGLSVLALSGCLESFVR